MVGQGLHDEGVGFAEGVEALRGVRCIKENPGPDVAVIAFAPAQAAPMTAPMDPISSSIWMNIRSAIRAKRFDICSMISVEGVMG